MSWWTEFRDGLETAAALVVNYWVPGSGLILGQFASDGAQENLFGSDWGRGALALSGLAGGFSGGLGSTTAGAADGFSTGAGATLSADELARNAMLADGISSEAANVGAAGQYGTNSGLSGGLGNSLGDEPIAGLNSGSYGSDPYGPTAGSTGAAPTFGSSSPFTSSGTAGNVFNPQGTGAGGSGNSLGGGLATAGNVGKATGAMPWGSPSNVLNMLQGAGGLLQAAQLSGAAGQAQRAADPFGPKRQYYADQLEALSRDPSSITKLPGYEAGMQAIKRSMASQGYTGSGNMMAAMQKYGGDFYNQTLDRYAGLAGAQFNPAAGAQLGLQGKEAAISLAGQSLNRLGYGAQMAGNRWPWEG